jgi:8-oxo-dGTP diphosphatase
VNDFKLYPPGLDEGGNHERTFYAHNTVVHETEKKKSTLKPVTGTALNHRISMCCVVFGYEEGELKILLLEGSEGEAMLELPGRPATENQTLEISARQMVHELSGCESFFIEQLYSFGNPGGVLTNGKPTGKGPLINTWEITVAFFALLNADSASPSYAFSNSGAKWYSLDQIIELSAHQNRIVTKALATLRFEICHFPIAFELLPEKFTLLQVQSLYEAISGKKLDKRNFIKKLKTLNLVLPSGEKQKNAIARPSGLFVFNRDVYTDSHNSIL